MYFIEMFFKQWVMEILELILLGKILKRKMEYQRIFFSAVIGSAAGCFLLKFYSKYHTLMFLLIEPVFIIMIKIAFEMPMKKAAHASMYAWIIAMLSGGIFTMIRSSFVFPWGIGALITALILWNLYRFYEKTAKNEKCGCYEVIFSWNNKKVNVCGFVDTGNFLYEPISNLPVSILEEKTFQRYFHHSLEVMVQTGQTDKICFIPFQSVGREHGVMTGMIVSNLTIIKAKQRIEIPRAVIAISKVSLSTWGHYEMLLHPDLMKNGR